MQIIANQSLKNYNTFGIDVKAKAFCDIDSPETLVSVLRKYPTEPLFIIGGGSNMLLTKDVDALVLHINLKGIHVLEESEETVLIEAQAGENWHEFVSYCLSKDFGGLENLSLIPGNVGTAPIQNIGAYGVELQDTFDSCIALDRQCLEMVEFGAADCRFGYRDSIFKNEAKDRYIILAVRFRLTKKNHTLHTDYGAIQSYLEDKEVTIQSISEAVIAIRKSKLPDPKVLGNSGSFFKNPILRADQFQDFRRNFPEAPFYEVSPTEFKVPAGWLIEQAGFKGKRFGDAGVHKNQALVLVNHGNATGSEIWNLALRIQEKVVADFGIYIEPEVNVF